ncbi:hypothetical protein [Gracilimonas sediminicola]|uniref:hypothetical protein n=1 Tax=Gracilimonas sediminicola TaxID=2952158 RepID=UPI0038D4B713
MTITYDTYFKSYRVKFVDENGRTISNTYSYISDLEGGWKQYKDDSRTYYIKDLLDEEDQNLQVEFAESPVDWAKTYFIYSFE